MRRRYTSDSFEDVSYLYEQAGIYFPTLQVTDSEGHLYTDVLAITVLTRDQVDKIVRRKWGGFKNKIVNAEIEAALGYFVSGNKEKYSAVFSSLGDDLIPIITSVEGITVDSHTGQSVEAELIRTENGESFSYPIIFVRDENGIWRIYGF